LHHLLNGARCASVAACVRGRVWVRACFFRRASLHNKARTQTHAS
jgi:hypothetical protein